MFLLSSLILDTGHTGRSIFLFINNFHSVAKERKFIVDKLQTWLHMDYKVDKIDTFSLYSSSLYHLRIDSLTIYSFLDKVSIFVLSSHPIRFFYENWILFKSQPEDILLLLTRSEIWLLHINLPPAKVVLYMWNICVTQSWGKVNFRGMHSHQCLCIILSE